MKVDIDKIIEDQIEDCEEFDQNFCDSIMCSDCGLLNRNLSIEYSKINEVCRECSGLGVVSSLRLTLFKSVSETKTCNVCGGSGQFIYSIER